MTGVETATKISELVATNPPGSDPKSEGDNHLRLIKSVLQDVFNDAPNSGDGGNQILFGFGGDFSDGLRLTPDPDLENDADIVVVKTLNAETADLQAQINTVIHNIRVSVKTTSGTYTKPANLRFLEVWVIGGGGGGSRAGITAATTASAGGGGGGGGCAQKLYAAADLAASEAYTVGAGGLSPSGVGAAGGNSTFKGLVGNGGAGGGALMSANANFAVAPGTGAAGGAATGGDINRPGQPGGQGVVNINSPNVGFNGAGGASAFARGLPSTWTFSNFRITGTDGTFPGGGASGDFNGNSQATAGTGNIGGAGAVILKEYLGALP